MNKKNLTNGCPLSCFCYFFLVSKEKFEDTKRITRSRKSQTIQWAKDNRTNNDLQNTIQKLKMSITNPRYDNVTLSPLLLPARVTNRSHSTYGSSARGDSHRAVFCPNSVVSGWKN